MTDFKERTQAEMIRDVALLLELDVRWTWEAKEGQCTFIGPAPQDGPWDTPQEARAHLDSMREKGWQAWVVPYGFDPCHDANDDYRVLCKMRDSWDEIMMGVVGAALFEAWGPLDPIGTVRLTKYTVGDYARAVLAVIEEDQKDG